MGNQTDLLSRVVAELTRRSGSLRAVASDSGVRYDTVLRIKNGEGDPGYSKVRTLARYLGIEGELTATEGGPAVPAAQEG